MRIPDAGAGVDSRATENLAREAPMKRLPRFFLGLVLGTSLVGCARETEPAEDALLQAPTGA